MSDYDEMKPVLREDGTVDEPFRAKQWPFNVPIASYPFVNDPTEPCDHFTVFEQHMILPLFNQLQRMKESHEGKLEKLGTPYSVYFISFYSQL